MREEGHGYVDRRNSYPIPSSRVWDSRSSPRRVLRPPQRLADSSLWVGYHNSRSLRGQHGPEVPGSHARVRFAVDIAGFAISATFLTLVIIVAIVHG